MPKAQIQQRVNWGKDFKKLPALDLAKVQLDSYNWFLSEGIRQALEEINPITDFTGDAFKLEFSDHYFGPATHTPDECLRRGLTFEAPLRARATLTTIETGAKQTQEIFLGDVPMMTSRG